MPRLGFFESEHKMTLQERFDASAEVFKLEIKRLAEQAGKTTLAVYALWREYSQTCTNSDQSPLLSEFAAWYKAELMPKQAQAAEAFEEKQEAKVERLEDAADKHQERANVLHSQAKRMADVMPFGQPILIGHHSEKRDRRYRDRIHGTFSKSFEEQGKAEYYARRAETAANGSAIKSEDPNADNKLAAEIQGAERMQATMKECNAAIRKHAKDGEAAQVAALVALGRTTAEAQELIKPDFCGRIGFADYALTNNSANIRRLKKRLEAVAVAQATPETIIEGSNARFEDCPPDNRVRLYYPGKPSEEIRSRLKSSGFRWSPTVGAWQAYRNNRSIETAKREAGINQEAA